MKSMDQSGTVWIRIGLCAVILLTGFGGFVVLKKMKKPPVQTAAIERPLSVEVAQVRYSDFPVRVIGYGEVRSRAIVAISSEVSGKVIAVHPNLNVGGIIREGEVLLAFDDRDYELEHETAKSRLSSLQRDSELAVKEYERLKSLYEDNKTGTLSAVERAESAVNAIADRISQVELSLASAKLRIERSVIKAPFTCRITELSVELYEYITPGKKLMTVTDDSDLEVIVSLDSRDVIKWLEFDPDKQISPANWFAPLAGKECIVEWTEDSSLTAKGKVDRIVRFDQKTRTMHVAVRLEQTNDTPVAAGMFCRITIPGRILNNVVVLPRHAVSFENTVYVANENRLQTRHVKVVRFEKEQAVIGEGLQEGDFVITTRLEQPLENALLSVIQKDAPSQ